MIETGKASRETQVGMQASRLEEALEGRRAELVSRVAAELDHVDRPKSSPSLILPHGVRW